jgi:hypothetical protein
VSEDGEGFLARWSRRKASTAAPVDAAAVAPAPPAPVPTTAHPPVTVETQRGADTAAGGAPAAPLPTLADVAALTRHSDYTRFMLPGVDSAVRNAAMKKLFSDPHFNVMDGLDTYIDDYGKPDPLPMSMLRRMHQSEALGLFRDEVADVAAGAVLPAVEAKASPDGAAFPAVAPLASSELLPADPRSRAEDDPDLRLQPDDVDRRRDAGPGPRG